MENWTHKDIFEIAWKHFEVIAEQRLKTFNFYVILLAASVGAALAALEHNAGPYIIFICGLFSIDAGAIFLVVEIRSRRLLEVPKSVLTTLKIGDHWPEELRLFSVDNLRQSGLTRKGVSYSAAFRLTMIAHIVFGVMLLLMAWCPAINPTLKADQESSRFQLLEQRVQALESRLGGSSPASGNTQSPQKK